MSRFWPQAEYAEDQRFSKSILTTHVVYRGLQTGTVVRISYDVLASTYRRFRSQSKSGTIPMPAVSTAGAPSFRYTLIRGSAVGSLYGAAITMIALPFYMRGQTDVQWKDRAWRLLANQGQVEVDDFSLAGMGMGGLTALAKKGGKDELLRSRTLNLIGRARLGGLAGVAVYMGWRYGIIKGQREGAK